MSASVVLPLVGPPPSGRLRPPPLLACRKLDHPPTLASSARFVLRRTRLNLLLAFVPLALLARPLGWPGAAAFVLNFLAIVPLAKLLDVATEELALIIGRPAGRLLNTTVGNAIEFFVAFFALQAGLNNVVQASLLGSILFNLLVVLGCSFAFAGVKYHEQTFNITSAQTNCSLLTLSVLSLLLPAAFRATVLDEYYAAIIPISHGAAVTMLIVYMLFLLFELKTHKDLFVTGNEDKGVRAANMTTLSASALLVVVVLVVALCAHNLVGSIEGVVEFAGLTKTFIGLVILPIICNFSELVTAITSAMDDNVRHTIAIAFGSSIQTALLLTPAMVVFGWIIGTEFTLFFNVYETSVLLVSVMVTSSLLIDGKCNWLEGVLLIAAHTIISISFFYFPDHYA